MQHFKELHVWRKAHLLVLAIYRNTGAFPYEERFGLRAQLRRSAASVPANIAEGCVRGTDRDFARFLRIALGSASEVDYYLLLARDLQLLGNSYSTLADQASQVKRMLSRLIAKLASS